MIMKKVILLAAGILLLLSIDSFAQNRFRTGIFLHHSTGWNIWGPTEGSTSVPDLITTYNTNHSYSGTDACSLDEQWFPDDENEWHVWHRLFNGTHPSETIQPFLDGNKIVMIKSCFPSSAIEGYGVPGDSAYFDYKTVENYKWHWRCIIQRMSEHPSNFFVIWTNAPLIQSETTPDQAMLSHIFSSWAKDTLAAGLDPVFGAFPLNVYVFDFFHKLAAAPNYYLPVSYAIGDSHPNGAAATLVAPQLVQEIFDAAIGYESVVGGLEQNTIYPAEFSLKQNYPNPFNPATTIKYSLPEMSPVRILIYDAAGQIVEIIDEGTKSKGMHSISFNGEGLSSGIYFYKLESASFTAVKCMLLIK